VSHHHNSPPSDASVSIIIPTRDKFELLQTCIESIFSKTHYKNFELIVMNNNSVEQNALDYLEELKCRAIKVIDYPHPFNYSKICNLGASESKAEYLCFLNNDTEILDGNWLTNLMAHATQPRVGVVGSKLLYTNGTIQNLGVALGYRGVAGHPFSGLRPDDIKLDGATDECFEVSAVTFACAVMSKSVFFEISSLDEDLAVGLNDVDICIRLRSGGRKNVVCNQSVLFHSESKSRRSVLSPKGFAQATKEVFRFLKKHPGDSVFADYFFGR
jgi:GT2 family glycosyltransferase